MRKVIASAGAAGLIAVGLSASPAMAEPGKRQPQPFLIQESQKSFGASMTFTASGPLCRSGTWNDDLTHFAETPNAKWQMVATTVYTCDDGSGTFSAEKNTHLQFFPDGGAMSHGPFRIVGGTGAYEGLHGSGRNDGEGNWMTGDGSATIRGHLTP